MGIIEGIILTLFVAVFSRLLADDAKAWSPWLVEWLMQRIACAAAGTLPRASL